MENQMPFIPMNLEAVKESAPVPSGKYDVIIATCEETKTKAEGRPQFKMSLAIQGHENAPNCTHYQSIPSEMDAPDKVQFKMLLLKRMMALFQIPINPKGFDTSELAMQFVGKTATVELGLSEPDDSGNVYNRLVVPRMKAEGEQTKGKFSPPKRAA
jgi:hypothetical protein